MFAFRYHATEVTNPRQARHALAYVLNNWRRHREDDRSERARRAALDPYSSALLFDGWSVATPFVVPADYVPLPVAPAQTWLLRVGWKQGGALLGVRERPGRLRG